MDKWNKLDRPAIREAFGNSSKVQKAVRVDVEKYDHFLENSDMTQEAKEEYIKTMWDLLMNFVDLGFGIHPLQDVIEENSIELEGVNADNKKDISKKLIDEPTGAVGQYDGPTLERKE